MAKKYECVFKRVNGDNTGSFVRSGMSSTAPILGVLYMRNCPDGKTFYCDASDGGTNSYYRLLDPQLYGVPSGYVCISKSLNCFTSVKLIEEEEAKVPNNVEEVSKGPVYITIPDTSDPGSNITFTNAVSSSAIKNARGVNTAEKISGKYTTYKRTDYYNNYGNDILNDMKIIESNLNIVTTASKLNDIKSDMVNKFNRFKIAFPDIQLSKSFAHVFFTRPDLNLYDTGGSGHYKLSSAVSNDPVYYYLHNDNPQLLKSLTSGFSGNHDLNPFLSNMARSFQLKDEELKTDETVQSLTGHKLKYGMSNIESMTAGEFSVRYIDDNEYRVYKIHKAWIDYISKVYRGIISPKNIYVRERILDYACSVYYFLCAEDGETILFWSKYTGVFPVNTPSSASSWTSGDVLKMPDLDITYAYGYKEDFNPVTLAEFNMNSGSSKSKTYVKTYDPELVSTGRTFTNAPFVETVVDSSGSYVFKLRYRK